MKKKVVYKSKNLSTVKGRFRRLSCNCGQIMFVFEAEFQKLEASRKPVFCVSGHPLRIDNAVLSKWPEDIAFDGRIKRLEMLTGAVTKAITSATLAARADLKEITLERKALSRLIRSAR